MDRTFGANGHDEFVDVRINTNSDVLTKLLDERTEHFKEVGGVELPVTGKRDETDVAVLKVKDDPIPDIGVEPKLEISFVNF